MSKIGILIEKKYSADTLITVQYSSTQYSTVPGGHVAQGGVVQTVPEVVMHLVWPHAEVGVLPQQGDKMVSRLL